MTTANLTDTDLRLRDAVTRQLDWDPEVDASAIGIAVKSGTVTLTGYVGSYPGKLAAERAAKRVNGVRAVANDVAVRLMLPRTDTDIAQDVVRALEVHGAIPKTVQAVVHNGSVTLTGTVNWLFEKETAEQTVRHVRGVQQVLNHISVAPQAAAHDLTRRIVGALHHDADVEARHITVAVSGNLVTLTGTVATWLQRDSAERAAANAPGVAQVDNQIVVNPVPHATISDLDDLC